MKKNELTKPMKEVISLMVPQVVNGMDDEQIITANISDKIGDRECTTDLLNDLLLFAKEQIKQGEKPSASTGVNPQVGNAPFFGNLDDKQKHEINPIWKDSIVVRESVSMSVGARPEDKVEVPSSVQLKPFDKYLFDTHVKQGMFKGKNIEVLHDPRKEA